MFEQTLVQPCIFRHYVNVKNIPELVKSWCGTKLSSICCKLSLCITIYELKMFCAKPSAGGNFGWYKSQLAGPGFFAKAWGHLGGMGDVRA